jgi:acyl carrier protein
MGAPEVVSREDLYALLRLKVEAIRAKMGGTGPLPAFDDDANLFDLDLVDSLSMVEIVLYVEELDGRPVDFFTVDPETFFTFRGIFDYMYGRDEQSSGGG